MKITVEAKGKAVIEILVDDFLVTLGSLVDFEHHLRNYVNKTWIKPLSEEPLSKREVEEWLSWLEVPHSSGGPNLVSFSPKQMDHLSLQISGVKIREALADQRGGLPPMEVAKKLSDSV